MVIPVVLGLLLLPRAGFALGQVSYVEQTPTPGSFPIVQAKRAATVAVDSDDHAGVVRAAGDLRADIKRVTNITPSLAQEAKGLGTSAILVGTVGKSHIIDRLIREGKIDARPIRSRWESFLIQVVPRPLPGVASGLVIAGSDKRGTIYGIYDLSEQIGVSPWYWWADVPVKQKNALFVKAGKYVQGPPAVKYRGIFLNDEAPAMSGWAHEKFGGFNSKMYAHVFELLLRLKANYLWPAMWGRSFFEDDPESPRLANEYGIVVGTSHHEPMMRAQRDWSRQGGGAWDYVRNGEALRAFWAEGVRRNKNYETITTIGMRGDGDEPMMADADAAAKLMETIVADQRKIIAEQVNPDVEKVPQLWALYKEVQEYYEKGMRVPDDVTLLWADDNWGNLRRLPTAEERQRRGGSGVYYHFDYVGGPRSYKWLNTVPITKVWEQMNLAHHYGADRIWIVNVGDLKPMEFPIEFFLHLAWNPRRWPKERLDDYTRLWAQREFGPTYATEIADIIDKYTKYNGRRKPELIAPNTFSLVNYQEADRVLADWKAISDKAEQIYNKLPQNTRDAFYQLVLYPTKASAVVTALYITAGKNHLYAGQGRAGTNDLAAHARALFQTDAELSAFYNQKVASGKWNHMMDQTHIGFTSWRDPRTNIMPAVREIEVPAAAAMGVAVEGSASAWPAAGAASEEPTLPQLDVFHQQSRYLDVFNRGKAPFAFTVTPSAPWIKVSGSSGTIDREQRLWVSIDWKAVPPGLTDGSITIAQTGTDNAVTVKVRAFNPQSPTPSALNGFVETNGYVSIEAEHYTRKIDAGPVRWEKIADYGRTLSSMTVFPVTAPDVTPPRNSPCLEYRMYVFHPGKAEVETIIAPTLDFVPGRALRFAVSFDDEAPQIIEVPGQTNGRAWSDAVTNNAYKLKSTHTLSQPGYHTLKVWMVDPGVVLQKLVVNLGGVKSSYLGPPESYRNGSTGSVPSASSSNVSSVAPVKDAPWKVPPLKDAFKGKFLIGTVLGAPALQGKAPMDVAIATTHFNAITPSNSMKPDALQPTEGQFNFTDGDRLVELAEQSGSVPIGHTLVWHNQTPKWFFEGPDGQPAGRELALARLCKHIATVVGHYKGRVKQWDVVNEAINDGPGVLRQTPWLKAVGEDYTAEAFRAAHEADPDALLIYNDYNIERPYKRSKALQLLKSLLDQKVPIHAVGIQAHWRMPDLNLAEVEESIKQFAALGLKVMITEMDIGVLPSRTQGADITAVETMTPEQAAVMNSYTQGLPDEVAQQQAALYRQAFEMFLRHKDVIGRVSFWGTHDGVSWLNNFPIRGRTDYPLLFDRQGQPKPTFFAVRDAAQSAPGEQRAAEGGAATPAPRRSPSAAVPSPRTDPNSLLAHEQLVAKAKAGGIDLYFLGDSITRRWGTSDPQYTAMLANWRKNFFGWNAGNFGWGADAIQNMLWRIQNGELDGVNPKVIVILAGTNNVGQRPGGDTKVADIVRGIRALIDTCRQKAPGAKIILTAIFPRNDNMAVLPEIGKINDEIARFADGKNIFYLNVNDKLANPDGTLKEGMSPDKLHLTVQGYQVWADGLRPLLTKLLGPPAATDHAPLPTGDPSATNPAAGS